MDDYFLSLAGELISKYKRVSHFTSNSTATGRYHEEALKSVLRMFLPDRYSLKTGFVYLPRDKTVSKQCDIIIIDESEPNSYLFRDGDFVIVHPAAVVCVIEVKTKIDKKEFLNIHKASKAFSKLRKQGRKCQYMAFSYDSVNIRNDEQLARWYKSMPALNEEEYTSHEHPLSIVSLEGTLGFLLSTDVGTDAWGVRKIFKSNGDTAKWRLAVFLMNVRTLVDLSNGNRNFSNLDWAVDFEGAVISANRFRSGEDMVQILRHPERT